MVGKKAKKPGKRKSEPALHPGDVSKEELEKRRQREAGRGTRAARHTEFQKGEIGDGSGKVKRKFSGIEDEGSSPKKPDSAKQETPKAEAPSEAQVPGEDPLQKRMEEILSVPILRRKSIPGEAELRGSAISLRYSQKEIDQLFAYYLPRLLKGESGKDIVLDLMNNPPFGPGKGQLHANIGSFTPKSSLPEPAAADVDKASKLRPKKPAKPAGEKPVKQVDAFAFKYEGETGRLRAENLDLRNEIRRLDAEMELFRSLYHTAFKHTEDGFIIQKERANLKTALQRRHKERAELRESLVKILDEKTDTDSLHKLAELVKRLRSALDKGVGRYIVFEGDLKSYTIEEAVENVLKPLEWKERNQRTKDRAAGLDVNDPENYSKELSAIVKEKRSAEEAIAKAPHCILYQKVLGVPQDITRIEEAAETKDPRKFDEAFRSRTAMITEHEAQLRLQELDVSLVKYYRGGRQADYVSKRIGKKVVIDENGRLKVIEGSKEELDNVLADAYNNIEELVDLRNTVEARKRQIDAQQSIILDLEGKRDAAAKRISELEEKIASLESNALLLDGKNKSLSEGLSSANAKAGEFEADNARINANNKLKQQLIEQLKREKEAAEGELNGAREELEKTHTLVGQQEEQINTLTGRIGELEGTLEERSELSKEELERLKAEYDEKIKEKDEEIKGYDRQISGLKGQLTKAQTALSDATTNKARIEAAVAAERAKSKSDLRGKDDEIKRLKSENAALDLSIADLEGKVEASASEIGKLTKERDDSFKKRKEAAELNTTIVKQLKNVRESEAGIIRALNNEKTQHTKDLERDRNRLEEAEREYKTELEAVRTAHFDDVLSLSWRYIRRLEAIKKAAGARECNDVADVIGEFKERLENIDEEHEKEIAQINLRHKAKYNDLLKDLKRREKQSNDVLTALTSIDRIDANYARKLKEDYELRLAEARARGLIAEDEEFSFAEFLEYKCARDLADVPEVFRQSVAGYYQSKVMSFIDRDKAKAELKAENIKHKKELQAEQEKYLLAERRADDATRSVKVLRNLMKRFCIKSRDLQKELDQALASLEEERKNGVDALVEAGTEYEEMIARLEQRAGIAELRANELKAKADKLRNEVFNYSQKNKRLEELGQNAWELIFGLRDIYDTNIDRLVRDGKIDELKEKVPEKLHYLVDRLAGYTSEKKELGDKLTALGETAKDLEHESEGRLEDKDGLFDVAWEYMDGLKKIYDADIDKLVADSKVDEFKKEVPERLHYLVDRFVNYSNERKELRDKLKGVEDAAKAVQEGDPDKLEDILARLKELVPEPLYLVIERGIKGAKEGPAPERERQPDQRNFQMPQSWSSSSVAYFPLVIDRLCDIYYKLGRLRERVYGEKAGWDSGLKDDINLKSFEKEAAAVKAVFS